jgi:hypothetical protein
MDFYSHQGDLCRVSFFVEGYVGDIGALTGTSTPFLLREFNTDEDIFKPIRALIGDVEVVTSSSGVTADSFLANSDTDIELRFFFINTTTPFWRGFVLQTEFQEIWSNQNHVLKISATDGFGLLKNSKLTNPSGSLDGMWTPFQYLAFACANMPLDFTKYTIINNLYHDSMSTTLPQTCLVQTKIDSRTFEETPTLFNDNYAVLENINKAFNQTVFQQNNEFVLLRLEELYTPTSTNLRGVQVDGATTTNLSRRYDVQIGVNQTLKPISPEMLRFIKRQVKSNTIQFDYTPFDEVIKNSSFSRGALVSSYPTFKDYSIENFSLVSNFLTDTPVTGVEVFRRETYVSNVGPLSDNYIIIPQASLGGNNYLLKSQSVRVSFGERIKIVIDSRFTKTFNVNPFLINTKVATLVVKLVGATTTYYLNEKGDWQTYDSGNFYSNFVRIEYNDTEKIKPEEWQTLEVESLPFIESGNLSVYLAVPVTPDEPGQERYFKNLKIEIANQFDTNEIQISGVQSIFNKNTDLKFEFNDSIIFDSTSSPTNKGSLYENDGVTIADDNWYRFRYSGERQGFRKENAIARWSHNRYDRSKIDLNLYGVKWLDGATSRSISFLNTFVFTNDDSNKVYYISNIREIDYAAATISLSLEEVWDNARDGAAASSRTFSTTVKTGTYLSKTTVPFNTTSSKDFVVTADDKIYYKGPTQLTNAITISLAGNIIATTSTPITVTFLVKQNGTTIKTQTYSVSVNPQAFTFNLSPTGSITINPNDYFEISYSSTITSIQYTSGTFAVSGYSIPNALDYDDYRDKYLYE